MTTRLLSPDWVCRLSKNYREKSSQTPPVYRKLNFYKGTKGLYHISTNFAPQLIIKQSHRSMFTTGKQKASLEWIMMYNEFYTSKPLISEVPSHFIFKSVMGSNLH